MPTARPTRHSSGDTNVNRHSIALALVVSSALAATAMAAPTSWDVPAGAQPTYTYSGGETANNHFGTGNTYSDGFYFIPGGLRATANGSAPHGEVADTASVILNANPGFFFSRISSGMLGDFTIFNGGAVNATGTIKVTNLDTALSLTAPLAFGGTVPVATDNAEGFFSGAGAIDLPEGWANVKVELDGFVSADASGNGSSLIQVKDAEISVETAQIPVPAALAVAPIAVWVGLRARRVLGFKK
jgi:hypothetical protein